MAKWPNWKELKKTLDDPERREELRRNLQTGAERGRDGAAKRLAGPAAHLRDVGSQFKAGLTEPEPAQQPDPASPTSSAPETDPPATPAP
jgi:hypothetical protein